MSKSQFYSHMVDETTDAATKNQMSIILRYVSGGELKERFWGFFDVSDLAGSAVIEQEFICYICCRDVGICILILF